MLNLGETDINHRFLERWNLILDFVLEAAQEVRSEHGVQLVNLVFCFDITELFHKPIKVAKVFGLQVVEEGEQLLGVILNWRSRQKHNLAARVLLE